MNSREDRSRAAVAVGAGVLLLGAMACRGYAQSAPSLAVRNNNTSEETALAALQSEKTRGPWMSYAQRYRSGGKIVSLQGTYYAGITAVRQSGCSLHIETIAVDRFSGSKGRKRIPETWNRYESAVDFRLTGDIGAGLRVIAARPAQLEEGTYAMCDGAPSCRMEWLEIRAAQPAIKVRRLTNDVAGYDGMIKDREGLVTSYRIPLSSSRTGEDLIAKLRDLAQTCRDVPAIMAR
jgi:hypothetical protein